MAPARMLYALVVFSLLLASLGVRPAAAVAAETPGLQALTVKLAPEIDPGAVGRGQTIELIFSEAMDPASANPALMTYPYRPGRLTWSADHKRLSFAPDGGFDARAYTLFLDRDLRSASGRRFAETQQWQVQVVPGPRVVSRQPAESTFQNLRPDISILFDRPMDLASVQQGLKIEPPLQYSAQQDEKTVILSLQEAMRPGTIYRFEINRPAHDLKGEPLEEPYAWEYRPAPLAVEVQVVEGQDIYLLFNYPIDVRATGTPFAIAPPIDGAWSWVNEGAFFSAEKPLNRAQRYTITFTAPLYSLGGANLGTPAPLRFAPNPPILETVPLGDWVSLDLAAITIHFLVPVDHASVEKAFSISPAVKGHFEWNDALLRYRLDEWLVENTRYTVTLGPTALDAEGNPLMLDPYVWTFKTNPYNAYEAGMGVNVHFGCEGPNVQVVDANGSRSILFSEGERSTSPVEFSLYALPLNQFAQVYRQFYRNRGYTYRVNDEDTIPTRGLKRQAYWQVQGEDKIQAVQLPGDAPAGLYVLSAAQDGEVQDQLLVALTYNTLVVKKSASRLWVWASDINGASLPDVEIRLYTQDGQKMRQGKTNEEGVFETTLPKDSPPLFVAARGQGEDVTIAGFGYNWYTYNEGYYGYWNLMSDTARPGERGDYQPYVYTDRPIYRPGDTVQFKVILRQDDDARYTTPASGSPVQARVVDPRGNLLQTYDLTTNEYGTAAGSFAIGSSGGLGEYRIEVSPGMQADAGRFKVEDYRKPDYQVTVTTDKDVYYEGEAIQVEIDTRYFFGKPVPNAQLIVRKYQLQSWWWWTDAEGMGADAAYTWIQSGEANAFTTDSEGRFRYKTTAAVLNAQYDEPGCVSSWRSSLRRCTWAIEVTAEDGSGQSVSGAKIYHVYNSDEKLTIDAGNWLKKPGETFTVQAKVTTVEGDQPISNRELVLDVMNWRSWDQTTLNTYPFTSGADGTARLELALERAGSYELRVRPADAPQNAIYASDWLYVYAAKDHWAQDAWGSFRISAEQTRYKPYEKARLAIESSFSGPAVLTFERGQVIHSRPILLTAPLTVIETEIIPEYAPNVFVTVNAWQPVEGRFDDLDQYFWGSQANSTLKLAQVELQVESAEKTLNIAITPERETYAPREEAVFDIVITDAQNRPVEAEFSVAVVDEAIFALSGELAQPIFQAFYGRKEHEVATFNSLAPARTLGGCAEGRGGGGGGYSLGNPRGSFPDTAAWFPALVTDANGRASVKVTLPDSLTTWRVLVKAVTKNTRVGEGSAHIVTQQEVVVQPLLPRILTVGDEVELSALVHNYSGQAREFALTLVSEALAIQQGANQTVNLQADEARVVSWRVQAVQAGWTEVTIEASPADGPGDAVRLPLEIRPPTVPEIYTQMGDFEGAFQTILSVPPGLDPTSAVEIRLSRSIAGNLLDGLAYLTGYPYGCVEQTMSRALPNAVVGRAFTRLGVENPQQSALDDMIRDGLQRLYGMQHADGGWGWWYDDDSTPYQTAWVVYGLALTAEAGYLVDPGVLERGVNYLKNSLGSPEEQNEMEPRLKAYVLYSLAAAGQGERAATLALAAHPEDLDPFSQAALALALRELGETQAARRALNKLEATVSRSEGLAWWETGIADGQYRAKTMASTTRSTALALSAYVAIAPHSELIPDVVRFLMSQRRALGWGTTNETAYAVMALTDHLLALQETGGEAHYQVALNGQTVAADSLGLRSPVAVVRVSAAELREGLNNLSITQEGADRLFYSVTSRMVFNQPDAVAAGPVQITRAYVHPETGRPIRSFTAGQIVRVKLEITFPTPYASYILVEDALPGGFEAVNERLNTSSHYGGAEFNDYAAVYYRLFWQEYGYNQKEIYGDRVTFFITEINRWEGGGATLQLDYLARVSHAGSFTALPAQVTAMYDESVWGRSQSAALEVAAGR